MSDDRTALAELHRTTEPGKPHFVLHYLYSPTEYGASEAATELRQQGFDTQKRPGADGINWLVLARHEIVPTEEVIAATRLLMMALAEQIGGEYDGWEAAVRPLTAPYNSVMKKNSRLRSLQRRLLEEIGQSVATHNFSPQPSGQTFYRQTDAGWVAFHLAFIEHGEVDFDVTADVAVRIEAVEEFVNAAKSLPEEETTKTASLGAELGNVSSGRQKRWTVQSESDVRPVAESLQAAFQDIAVPYFERFSSLEEILLVLSSNEPTAWLHSPIHGSRCQRAVALAYLLGKQRAEIDQLIERNEAFLRERNDFGLGSFRSLAERVRTALGSRDVPGWGALAKIDASSNKTR